METTPDTTTESTTYGTTYKWYILALGALTFTFVMAIPAMSLPVLFDEIAGELNLNLVQIGWIWGIGSLMGIAMGLVGGPLGDWLGPRRALSIACLIVGIVGAARGLAWNFTSLAATILVLGFATSAIPMSVHKICGVWFSGKRLGTANGVVSVGMAFGFMLGSLLAATVISPLLGGWRNVMFAYGVVAVIFALLWWWTHEHASANHAHGARPAFSLIGALRQVARLPNVWFLSFATVGVAACVNATLGYLPLYLRQLGWPAATADSALASFHAVSMVCAIPIALLSDRLGIRRGVLMTGALLVAVGVGLLASGVPALIWPAVIIAGLTRDGFMAITMTTMMEIKGVGARFAGSATGLLMAWMGLGNVIAPPLGNSLATINPQRPFVLWAGLAVTSLVLYLLFRPQTE